MRGLKMFRATRVPLLTALMTLSPGLAPGKPPEFPEALAAALQAAPDRVVPGREAEPLPLGADWSLADAAHETTATRERICLNGLWRFQPETAYGRAPATNQWAYLRVPGIWCDAWGKINFLHHGSESTAWHDDMMRYRRTGFMADRWEGQDLTPYSIAWYERLVTVPAAWRGRSVGLDITAIDTAGTVYLNGTRVGGLEAPGGRVALPAEAIRFGATNALTVRVVGYGYPGPNRYAVRSGWGSGLSGDVFLYVEPAALALSEPFLLPSTRREQLGIRACLTSAAPHEGCAVRVTINDADGRAVYEHREPLPDLPSGARDIEFAVPWMAEHLWHPEAPYLYRAELAVLDRNGAVLDALLPVTFGFREFWIEGRQFMLNGRPFRLRPYLDNRTAYSCEYSDTAVRRMLVFRKTLGFNALETRGTKSHPGEGCSYYDNLLHQADRAGMVVLWQLEDVVSRHETRDMSDPPTWAHYRARCLEAVIKRLRNHACILMWSPAMNVNANREESAPWRMGREPDLEARDPEWTKAMRRAADAIRELDPTRVVFFHDAGNLGPVFAPNYHFNFPPLQERVEYPSAWAEDGLKPLMFVEAADCYVGNFQKARMGGGNAVGEPLATEYLARLVGPRAYADETEDYVRTVEAAARGDGTWNIGPINILITQNPSYDAVASRFTVQTRRAWRTWGVPGGLVPWFGINGDGGYGGKPMGGVAPHRLNETATAADKAPGFRVDRWETVPRRQFGYQYRYTYPGLPETLPAAPYPEGNATYHALRRANLPLMAYIAGRPGRFTAQQHGYASGDRVDKQLALVWDGAAARALTARWRVADAGGTQIAGGEREVTLQPGDSKLLPVSFQAPAVTAPRHADMELTVTEGGGLPADPAWQDRFALQFYPPPIVPEPPSRTVVWDPHGETSARLEEDGVKGLHLDPALEPGAPGFAAALTGAELLVIGRRALTQDLFTSLIDPVAQGLAVLVFEQEAAALNQLGFRTIDVAPRHVFATSPAPHPFLAGIPAEGLHDWAGSSTLVDPYPKTLLPPPMKSKMYRWGNEGGVATVVIETPHHGAFTPVLDTEFDLRYSPLLSWRVGDGRFVFCQMDVTGRTRPEPAARRLRRNLLEHAGDGSGGARRRVLTLDAGTGALMDQYGFDAVHLPDAPALGAAGGNGLLVLSGRTPPATVIAAAPAVREFVRAGGVAALLYVDGEALRSGVLPFEAGIETASLSRTALDAEAAAHPALAGFGAGDLHYRRFVDVPLLRGLPDGAVQDARGLVAVVPHGAGRYVLWQLDPGVFDPAREIARADGSVIQSTFTRLSQWHVHRAVSQLLANQGAASAPERVRRETAASWTLDIGATWKARRSEAEAVARERTAFTAVAYDDGSWTPVDLPCGAWPEQGDPVLFGGRERGNRRDPYAVWYRRTVTVPDSLAGRDLSLYLGVIDDADETYFNGVKVGEISRDTSETFWKDESRYLVPASAVRYGATNVVAFRMIDYQGGWGGSMWGPRIELGVQRANPDPLYTEPLTLDDNPYRWYWW
ncbi:MAG: hypothetical protein JW951_04740 [Lentisphaerae bacterium]|nr:hypothetical protein [Lentisphaerota bacterium]